MVNMGTHVVLYDGVCGLCNRVLQFLLEHDHSAIFSFAPLQSPTAQAIVVKSGHDPSHLTTFYVVANFRTPHAQVLTKSDAALFVAGQLGWPWRAVTVARVLPRSVRDFIYDIVARNRYRVFGRYDQCLIPSEAARRRFVE
jgi:predicted DCC family thiol-disulfide oxidoreductase YuxK